MIEGSRRIKDLIRNVAKGDSAKAQALLQHYAMQRLLERLSLSEYRDDFILKGGMLVSSLLGLDQRTTHDIDTTMRGHDMDLENISEIIKEIAAFDIGDGFSFKVGNAVEIMQDSQYGGVRVPLTAMIGKTVIPFRIDISTGDVLTPSDIRYDYELMFEKRSISLRTYNIETALAEKLEAILTLGKESTRMRDFYDVWAIEKSGIEIDFPLLKEAFAATAGARGDDTLIDNYKNVIDSIAENDGQRRQWERYRISNPFVEGLTWDEVLSGVEKMMEVVKQAGATLSQVPIKGEAPRLKSALPRNSRADRHIEDGQQASRKQPIASLDLNKPGGRRKS